MRPNSKARTGRFLRCGDVSAGVLTIDSYWPSAGRLLAVQSTYVCTEAVTVYVILAFHGGRPSRAGETVMIAGSCWTLSMQGV